MSSRFKFPRRVRIHGGECGAVARALHHAAQKGALVRNEQSLISDEKAFLRQAGLKKAFGSTFNERKQMSTKTSIKRVALIAVSALGFGLMSVVPAKAAQTISLALLVADGGTLADDTVTGNGVAGPANTVTLRVLPNATKNILVTVSGASSTILSGTAGTGSSVTIATGGASAVIGADGDGTLSTSTLVVSTPAEGTVTAKSYIETTAGGGIYGTTADQTVTITVGASALSGVLSVAKSTSLVSAGADFTGATADEAVTSSNVGVAQAASILVTVKDGLGNAIANAAVSAIISGPGLIGGNADQTKVLIANTAANARVVAIADSGADGIAVFTVAGDGTGVGGKSEIKIYSGTTLIATESVTFHGKPASLHVTQFADSIEDTTDGDAVIAADSVGVVATIKAKDTEGVEFALSAAEFTAVSAATLTSLEVTNVLFGNGDGDPVAATVGVVVDPTATKTGSKSVVVTHTATGLTATIKFVVALGTATTVTMTTDKDTYAPGEKVTITVMAKDAGSNILPDGAHNLFSAANVTSSVALQGSLPAQAVTLAGGKATYTTYAPLAAGEVVLTGTEGSDTASSTKGTVTAKFNVTGGAAAAAAEAATEAAVEATDAANQAYEAAVVATETAEAAVAAAEDAKAAAEAATAAVEALATQVSTMMAELKAQVTALAKTVAKILKKV